MAKLNEIVALAEGYDAMVLVDDSHATGFIGRTGRGTYEHGVSRGGSPQGRGRSSPGVF